MTVKTGNKMMMVSLERKERRVSGSDPEEEFIVETTVSFLFYALMF